MNKRVQNYWHCVFFIVKYIRWTEDLYISGHILYVLISMVMNHFSTISSQLSTVGGLVFNRLYVIAFFAATVSILKRSLSCAATSSGSSPKLSVRDVLYLLFMVLNGVICQLVSLVFGKDCIWIPRKPLACVVCYQEIKLNLWCESKDGTCNTTTLFSCPLVSFHSGNWLNKVWLYLSEVLRTWWTLGVHVAFNSLRNNNLLILANEVTTKEEKFNPPPPPLWHHS